MAKNTFTQSSKMSTSSDIPSYMNNLNEIVRKHRDAQQKTDKNFDIFYFFSHNKKTLTKEQLETVCYHNTCDYDKLSMIDEIIYENVDSMYPHLGVIVKGIIEKEIRKSAFFTIGDAKVINDEHFRLLFHYYDNLEWQNDVLHSYCASHSTLEIDKFYKLIGHVPPFLRAFTTTSFETPEGKKVGFITQAEKDEMKSNNEKRDVYGLSDSDKAKLRQLLKEYFKEIK